MAHVGPVNEEHARATHVGTGPPMHAAQSHRTLDEALHELLAEWEQH